MNIFSELREFVLAVIDPLVPESSRRYDWLDALVVEPPRDTSHGDVSTNAAMVLSRPAAMKPGDLAEHIAEKLRELDYVDSVDIAGPGFINLRIKNHWLHALMLGILEKGTQFGDSTLGKDKPVNVEYVSANPTGPLHIGHARGAVVGDALANLLKKSGYNVTKEYYINDAGAQINALTWSTYYRYWQACGKNVDFSKAQYPGEYLISVAEGLKEKYGEILLGMDEKKWYPLVREFTLNAMMELIRKDLADLGIRHDVFTSEQSLHDARKIHEAIDELQHDRLVYRGVLEPPKGKMPEDWEPREQVLFRTTQFGDDCDRPLQKSDGSWTYFAADVAYMKHKLARAFDTQVMVLGADHAGYVRRMEASMKALTNGHGRITIVLCQLVKFMDGDQPMKMSKRAGTFTTVRDVIDAVGRDVIRFIMLTRKPEQHLDFDLTKVTEQSRENPVFYVQYAYARCRSLMRMAQEQAAEAVDASQAPTMEQLAHLNQPEEINLLRQLMLWPRVVEGGAIAREPHRVAYFLQDVAAQFHTLWNTGNDDITLRFIQKDAIDVTVARLALARATAVTIASGLEVLGVEPLEELR